MPPHILVIDDQISLPRFIAMELDAEGYHVSISCDDIAELSAIRDLKPDLIINTPDSFWDGSWNPHSTVGICPIEEAETLILPLAI